MVWLRFKIEIKPWDVFFFCSCNIVHVIEEPKGSRCNQLLLPRVSYYIRRFGVEKEQEVQTIDRTYDFGQLFGLGNVGSGDIIDCCMRN